MLAELLSVETVEIENFERGTVRIPAEYLFSISDFFKKPLKYFFDDLSSRQN